MKKLITTLFLSSSFSIFCQEKLVGANVGVNYSTFYKSVYFGDLDFKLGQLVSIDYRYITNKNLIFGSQLNYSNIGFSNIETFTDQNNEFIAEAKEKLNIHTLQIPLNFGYKFGIKNHISIETYLSPSFTISSVFKAVKFDNLNEIEKTIATELMNRFDVKMGFETAYSRIISEKISFQLKFGFNKGMLEQFKASDFNSSFFPDAKTLTFTTKIGLFYFLNVGKQD